MPNIFSGDVFLCRLSILILSISMVLPLNAKSTYLPVACNRSAAGQDYLLIKLEVQHLSFDMIMVLITMLSLV